jgi:aryl-alcohol dehydrogenase-like predicted oxidoreductase
VVCELSCRGLVVGVGRCAGVRDEPSSGGGGASASDPHAGWGANPETSEQILADYLDRGGNVVEPANVYANGHSEKIVGDFFAARPGMRERVVHSTKFFGGSEGDLG